MSESDISKSSSSTRESQHQREILKKKTKIEEVKSMFQRGTPVDALRVFMQKEREHYKNSILHKEDSK